MYSRQESLAILREFDASPLNPWGPHNYSCLETTKLPKSDQNVVLDCQARHCRRFLDDPVYRERLIKLSRSSTDRIEVS